MLGKNISGTLPTGTQLFPWKSSASHVFWYCAWTTHARLSLQGSPWSSSAEPMPGNVMFFLEKKHMKKWGGVVQKNWQIQPGVFSTCSEYISYTKTECSRLWIWKHKFTYCNTVPLPAPTSALFCQDSVLGSHSVEPHIREIGWRGCLSGMQIVSTVHIVYIIFILPLIVYCLHDFAAFFIPVAYAFSKKGLLKKAMVTWKYLHNRTLHKASISHPTGSSENHRLYSTKSCQVAPSPSSCMTYSLKRAHCNKSAGKNTKNEDWPTGPQSRLGKNVS